MRLHPFLDCLSVRLRSRHPFDWRELSNHVFFSPLKRSRGKSIVLSLTLIVTGCSTTSPTPSANQSTQVAKTQTSKQNTAQVSQSTPRSQRFATDRQNQLDDQGYSDGYGAGYNGSPANPTAGSANLTDPTEKTIYVNAYNRGYPIGKAEQPLTSPPTTVTPARRAELQQKGRQEGAKDARSNVAANPGSGIAVLGLRDSAEIELYTNAYNAAYQEALRSPTPTPERLNELKQQGYNDGYADAQANLSQDPNRSTTFLSLVDVTERQAYTNSYNVGYKRYIDSQAPPPDTMW